MPQTLKCPSCGAALQYDGQSSSVKCDFCNNVTLIPAEYRQAAASGQGVSSGLMNASQSIPLDKLMEIKELLGRGQKIQAIKIFRETFDVGLKEAKEAVEQLERGETVHLSEQQMMSFSSTVSSGNVSQAAQSDKLLEIHELLGRGQKIQAIKIFRETYHVGLKEAKDAVEQLQRGETVMLPDGQQVMAFNRTVDPNQVAFNANTATSVPGQVVLGGKSRTTTGQKSGCLGAFLGQFGCLLFLFFWIPFIIVMVGPAIFPDMVLWTAPLACEAGYQEVYAERVSYYSTGNFEGNNIALLHCVYEAGADDIPHPFKVDLILFAGPMAVMALLAFGISFLGSVRRSSI